AAAELPAARPGTLEYKTLLVSNLGSQVSDEDVEDALIHEFKKFGDVSVKLSHTPELGRIAYVNFRHPEDAKEARHAKSSRLLLGERPLKVEPMYVRRRSVTPPEVGYVPLHASYAYRQRSLSPPGPGLANLRDLRARQYALETLGLSRERERLLDYYGMLDERGRPYGFPPMPVVEDLKPEDDQRATSNLFIGNLDGNVTEAELRRGFDKYGIIEDVVIKRPARGQGGAYAFVKFQNLDMAHRAKVAMQGRLIGGNPIKIGYGKANPTTRLWVGGLGPGNSLAALAREFDRFGSIRNIDYVKGDSFAYIQYESLDAAQAACTQMRGFPLGGPGAPAPGGLRQGGGEPVPALPAWLPAARGAAGPLRAAGRGLRPPPQPGAGGQHAGRVRPGLAVQDVARLLRPEEQQLPHRALPAGGRSFLFRRRHARQPEGAEPAEDRAACAWTRAAWTRCRAASSWGSPTTSPSCWRCRAPWSARPARRRVAAGAPAAPPGHVPAQQGGGGRGHPAGGQGGRARRHAVRLPPRGVLPSVPAGGAWGAGPPGGRAHGRRHRQRQQLTPLRAGATPPPPPRAAVGPSLGPATRTGVRRRGNASWTRDPPFLR
ncbi:unnamed protein product, partial [Tetraodon nigroviridis]